MKFQSTRGADKPFAPSVRVSLEEAIVGGIADDGGLYVPEEVPKVDLKFIESLSQANYNETAARIIGLFSEKYTESELKGFVDHAYNGKTYASKDIVPLKKLDADTYVMELFHGPTSAFKDMALQLMPSMLVNALVKAGAKDKIAILVATSGDTGKAALEGYKDVEDTSILVFYPKSGVSEIQRLQMVTQDGNNVAVAAVDGNFDDAQTGVKAIFADKEVKEALLARGIRLSSANSINWGRLMPQIVYYFWAYSRLLKDGAISLGEKIRFCVPTGNFGDILAGWYAREMGLPVSRFICASNKNNVLTEFIDTGVYDRRRGFEVTISPAMDILISSNLERLLFELSDKDATRVSAWMKELSEKGSYDVGTELRAKIKDVFYGGFATEQETNRAICDVFKEFGYLIDTHTAVGYHVYREYKKQNSGVSGCSGAPGVPETSSEKTVLVSTASPFKFARDVYCAIASFGQVIPGAADEFPDDEFLCLELLEKLSGSAVPAQLKELSRKPMLHRAEVAVSDMRETAMKMIANISR